MKGRRPAFTGATAPCGRYRPRSARWHHGRRCDVRLPCPPCASRLL